MNKSLTTLAGVNSQDNFLLKYDDLDSIKGLLITYMVHAVGKDPAYATRHDWFYALSFMLRGILSERYINTARSEFANDTRRVYYLSMEYLLGRSLSKNLLDLGIFDIARKALSDLGQDLDQLGKLEHDPALGNGGLGRLAACFLESMVTHGYPGYGYGLRYDFGLFKQSIEDGEQVEHPDNWLRFGNPWEFKRPDVTYEVKFGGRCQSVTDALGRRKCQWIGPDKVIAMAYDVPVSGFGTGNVTNLRLWTARATGDFDLKTFNQGDYIKSVEDKTSSETLSKILYPDDSTLSGQELRLKQEYFFVSSSIQDILARHLRVHKNFDHLADKVAIQLNDTHPALGIAELMRILVDEHDYDWDRAWDITRHTFSFTNHTLLPEALERWPVAMLRHVLPVHLEIIYRINAQFLKQVQKTWPGDAGKMRVLSLVDDFEQSIRMAHLAIVGSHKVNGVAKLHTELLRANMFPEFDEMYPGKFVNVTNGVTPRRWILQANPGLSALITEKIGDGWVRDLSQLIRLESLADDSAFQTRIREVKYANKQRLCGLLQRHVGLEVSPDFMFDTQVKRIHEYKRQLLNVLHIIARYNSIRDGHLPRTPRVAIFAGKAAPSYFTAKLIIRLINDVAEMINNDPLARDHLKVAFVPDYNVAKAEIIIPGSDLSEQISTAGMEASGTGNMKFALNGALTIGTLDGANIEIGAAAGEENIFIFGLNADEVADLKRNGYSPWEAYHKYPELKRAIDMIGEGFFSPKEPDRYRGLYHDLLDHGDNYMLLADFHSYMDRQNDVDHAYQ
ncbi:MAG: glycogen phosphorylase, partial [Hyphomicrobiales bacterium]